MTTRKNFAEMRIVEFQAMAEADRLVRKDRAESAAKQRWSLARLVRIHRSPAAV